MAGIIYETDLVREALWSDTEEKATLPGDEGDNITAISGHWINATVQRRSPRPITAQHEQQSHVFGMAVKWQHCFREDVGH